MNEKLILNNYWLTCFYKIQNSLSHIKKIHNYFIVYIWKVKNS
jgi:hypothetical protein